jgi:thiamine-monophosphate kinase
MRRAAFKFEIDPTTCALSGGEDYELLFTIPQAAHDNLLLNEQISVIGYMTEAGEGPKIITKGGSEHPLSAQGWNHLK